MLISGFVSNKDKAKCFMFTVKTSKIIPLLFIGAFGLNVWHVLTISGLELTGGKDIYSLLNSVKLPNANNHLNYEHMFRFLR